LSEKDLEAYQITQQQLQLVLLQKQQLKIQGEEMDSALEELKKITEKEKVYKIVGPILIEVNKDEIVKELNEKKETLNSRLEILEKQEERLRKNLVELGKILEKELQSKEE
jgi:prefoldin beta subunit